MPLWSAIGAPRVIGSHGCDARAHGLVSAGSAGTDLTVKCSQITPLHLLAFGPRGVRKPTPTFQCFLKVLFRSNGSRLKQSDSLLVAALSVCTRTPEPLRRKAAAVKTKRSSSYSSTTTTPTPTYNTSGLRAQRPNRAHLGERSLDPIPAL